MAKAPFKIYFSLRTSKTAGLATIQARVSVYGNRSECFSTGLRIERNLWLRGYNRAKDRPDINISLSEVESELTGLFHLLKSQGKLSANEIRARYIERCKPKNEAPPLIMKEALNLFIAEECARIELDAGTKDKYKRYINLHLLPIVEGLGLSAKPASTIVRTQTDAIYRKIRESNMSSSYKGKLGGYLRTFCKWAHSHGYMQVDPMSGVRIARGTSKHYNLTELEQHKIRHAEIPADDLVSQYVRDMFVFQLETGLNYSDARSVRKDLMFVQEGLTWLVIVRAKSKEGMDEQLEELVWVTPEAYEIGERWNWDIIHYENPSYNRLLKVLAALAGINVKLTSRMARSTFAQNKVDQFSEAVVLRMMGHKSATTLNKHYARPSIRRIAREIRESQANSFPN